MKEIQDFLGPTLVAWTSSLGILSKSTPSTYALLLNIELAKTSDNLLKISNTL